MYAALNTETARPSETPMKFYLTIWRYIAEDSTVRSHSCENGKSNMEADTSKRNFAYSSLGLMKQNVPRGSGGVVPHTVNLDIRWN
jgi:hypothetical protein